MRITSRGFFIVSFFFLSIIAHNTIEEPETIDQVTEVGTTILKTLPLFETIDDHVLAGDKVVKVRFINGTSTFLTMKDVSFTSKNVIVTLRRPHLDFEFDLVFAVAQIDESLICAIEPECRSLPNSDYSKIFQSKVYTIDDDGVALTIALLIHRAALAKLTFLHEVTRWNFEKINTDAKTSFKVRPRDVVPRKEISLRIPNPQLNTVIAY